MPHPALGGARAEGPLPKALLKALLSEAAPHAQVTWLPLVILVQSCLWATLPSLRSTHAVAGQSEYAKTAGHHFDKKSWIAIAACLENCAVASRSCTPHPPSQVKQMECSGLPSLEECTPCCACCAIFQLQVHLTVSICVDSLSNPMHRWNGSRSSSLDDH